MDTEPPQERLGMGAAPGGPCLRLPAPAPAPFWLGADPGGAQRAKTLPGPLGPGSPSASRGTIGQWSRAGVGHPLCLPNLHPYLQAAPGARAWCIPRIVLTECAPDPPSPPEARLGGPGPRTTPTPRPRTLASGGRAAPEVRAEAARPSSGPRRGPGGHAPEEGGAGGPRSRGPAPDGTQEPSSAETRPEETPGDSGRDAQPGRGACEGQPGACPGRGASTRRRDSLEETLRELEATLSQMGTAPAERPPGSLPPPPPRPKSGGGSVPPMKVVTPGASRLKAAQGQAGSPDKSKHGKQRAEYMRIQAQQATKPSKEMSGSNETSSPVSEKPSASRTSIPVLTSFGARNSSISF